MSTRSKGNKNELRCQKALEAEGWLVQRCGYRRFAQNDFFSLWDCLAITEKETLFVQVKSNKRPYGKQLKKYTDFAEKYNQFDYQIWVHVDRKGWDIYTYIPFEKKWIKE